MKFITLSVTFICLLSTLSSSSYFIFEEIKSNKNVIKLQEKIDVLFDPFSEHKNPNPFKIDFPNQKDISPEEYLYIQEKLKEIDILPLLQKLYPRKGKYIEFEEFKYRCSIGINQKLINLNKDQFPITKLEKVGAGGEYCIVSCAPYDDNRNILLEGLIDSLHKTGFNGYIYYRIGGYPNPTGKEIKYCGVPYAIKIFMMMEARQLGFNKILWIDSALWPIRDPSKFFKHIDKTGGVFYEYRGLGNRKKYIFPKTRLLLTSLTGKDPCKSPHIRAGVFGLNFKKKKCRKFLKEYLKMVKMGTPFLSYLPEEFVFSCLLDKPEFHKCRKEFEKCMNFLRYEESFPNIDESIEEGFYFYHKIH